jgi:hypothetical protein
MADNDNVVRLKSSAPALAVVPVARKISSSFLVSPSEARRRAFQELTDAAARAYDAAAAHRLAGDEAGAFGGNAVASA